MNKIDLYITQGYLKTQEGLKYFQELINNELEGTGFKLNLLGFEDTTHPMDGKAITKVTYETDLFNVITITGTLTQIFNKNKRKIKGL